AAGTIEMDEVDVASQVGGRLVRLVANEGDTVRAGDTLAVLEQQDVTAALAAQMAQAQRATAQARDLAAGARPAELVVARSNLAAAQADEELARTTFARTDRLAKAGVVAQAELDRARATRDAAIARARAAASELQLQEDGFRRQQVAAAKEAAAAAQADLAGARGRAGALVRVAPRRGVVLLRNYEEGELVPAGGPVVTLGDPDSLWMRVYVAAPRLTAVRLGAVVEVRPVGAPHAFAGRVVQIATQAEFTPRAALTEEEQANLVFGVKVALAPTGGALKAGLPAEARIRGAP
ncbi:MAG TPA: HlyD family efflux transporter periplasmic adaptor subunit, partial [Candidatus Eisenbacteria bacterium]|nr:HlyD family efflux transporter periplasmic adaptor subunit [Candidatus Eisenbacteria bacterium]